MRDVGAAPVARIPVDTADEMGRLSGLNSMLGRLSQADAQIRAVNQRLAPIEAATHDQPRRTRRSRC